MQKHSKTQRTCWQEIAGKFQQSEKPKTKETFI
jgi:hypothetical protein